VKSVGQLVPYAENSSDVANTRSSTFKIPAAPTSGYPAISLDACFAFRTPSNNLSGYSSTFVGWNFS
jgi:hypothetical protein